MLSTQHGIYSYSNYPLMKARWAGRITTTTCRVFRWWNGLLVFQLVCMCKHTPATRANVTHAAAAAAARVLLWCVCAGKRALTRFSGVLAASKRPWGVKAYNAVLLLRCGRTVTLRRCKCARPLWGAAGYAKNMCFTGRCRERSFNYEWVAHVN